MLKDWYNRHIAARWYTSASMWVGILAGLPDALQMLYDNWGIASDALGMTEPERRMAQAVLLFVVMPIARAWRQKSITRATIKQALLNDQPGGTIVVEARK